MGWQTNWIARRPRTIIHGAGSGSGYQVTVNLLASDLYGLMNSDFSDIRFTSSNGTTLLNYSLISKVDSVSASFLVQIMDDLSTMDDTIYIYFGNSVASSTSSNATYDVYIDGQTDQSSSFVQRSIGNGNLGTLTWDSVNKKYTVVASLDNLMYEIVPLAGSTGYQYDVDWAMSSTTGVSNQFGMVCRYTASGLYYLSDYQRVVSGIKKLWIVREPNPPNANYVEVGANTVPFNDRIATQNLSTGKQANTFYHFMGRVYGSTLYCGENLDNLTTSVTDATYGGGSLGVFVYSGGSSLSFKNLVVVHYSPTPPTVGDYGSIEFVEFSFDGTNPNQLYNAINVLEYSLDGGLNYFTCTTNQPISQSSVRFEYGILVRLIVQPSIVQTIDISHGPSAPTDIVFYFKDVNA